MIGTIGKRLKVVGFALLVAGVIAQAANVEKALADSESRRRTAENGLHEIKKKSAEQAEQVRTAYTAAAREHNTWLDQVCRAIEGGDSTAPDATSAANAAASALVEWVAVRNRALDMPVMTSEISDAVKKSVVHDLTDITDSVWKAARGTDQQKRTRVSASLKERLRWKTWENVG